MIKLREFRIKNNLTLREVSSQLGIRESAICMHEKGHRLPSINLLVKYAQIYKCSVQDLIDD